MKGFKSNIEKATLENNNFRKVLYSGHHLQLVLMSLNVGEEIGAEIHKDNDQFFRFEGGSGKNSWVFVQRRQQRPALVLWRY